MHSDLKRFGKCRRFSALFAVLLVLWLPGAARAWVGSAHKIVAMIVWDELTPAARAKVIAILKQHPRYEQDLLQGLPAGSDEATAARHAFVVAATWPDMVKSQSNPMHFVANHPEWHYIDLPYHPDGAADVPVPTQPSDNNDVHPGPRDIVEALTKNSDDLHSPTSTNAEKAIALCWILHLGGDVHQPLHAIEMYSKELPMGDKGGNALLVLREPPYANTQMNLHLLWDELPGNFASQQPLGYLAEGLRSDPELSRDRLKDRLAVKDFASWAQESHELAVKYAYLNGTLKAAVAEHGAPQIPAGQIPGVPAGYLHQAERIAFRQIALAGYRTADLLNALLDPGSSTPTR